MFSISLAKRAWNGVFRHSLRIQQYASIGLETQSKAAQAQLEQVEKQAGDVAKVQIPDVLKHPDFFEVKNLFTIKNLFDARVHYGHTKGTLNEHMKQFILGDRLGTLIIDLDQTAELLKEALNFAAHIAFQEGIIMFVSRFKQNTYYIEKTAIECGEYSHTRCWKTGTFTDPTKFGMMTRFPDLVIFLNTLDTVFETHTAVLEANKLLIPTIGIVDTNCFPNYITYPVPGNDDSPQSIELFCDLFKEAILRGKAKRKEFEDML